MRGRQKRKVNVEVFRICLRVYISVAGRTGGQRLGDGEVIAGRYLPLFTGLSVVTGVTTDPTAHSQHFQEYLTKFLKMGDDLIIDLL